MRPTGAKVMMSTSRPGWRIGVVKKELRVTMMVWSGSRTPFM
jgi:hypothetical protein